MYKLFFLVLAVTICGISTQRRTPCRTPNETDGVCVIITECVGLQEALQVDLKDQIPEVGQYVRNANCGAEGNIPKVCCQNDRVVPEEGQLRRKRQTCVAPDGRSGTCISIYNCPLAISILSKPKPFSPEDTEYLAASRCQSSAGGVSVCCANQRTGEGIDPALLPSPSECGRQQLGDKVRGGEDTAIDEYPWMALVGYSVRAGGMSYACGGALISSKYVLTAAHCMVGEVLTAVGTPTTVRLGEWDLSTPTDCFQGDCADPVVEINIESLHPYTGYNPTNSLNDIGLIRLATPARRTDFINTICLPTRDIVTAPSFNTSTNYKIAGWGATESAPYSNIKQHLSVTFSPHSTCNQRYTTTYRRPLNSNSQICAGGISNQDSCRGDSGGPLMLNTNNVWTMEGIVSFGPTPCGREGFPGVYTKVVYYLPWIAETLKP